MMPPLNKLLASTKASLHMVDEQFLFVWKDGNKSRYKFVSPAAVRSAVAREPFDTGWIPPAVKRCGSSARGDWAVLWVPPQLHRLSIIDAKTRQRSVYVPLPGLAFAGIGRTYHVYATKARELAASTPLFHVPLPNVGGGQVCFGSHRVPQASAGTIEQAFTIFRDTAFNGHSVTGLSKKHPRDVRLMLFELAKARAKAYPARDLEPARFSVEEMIGFLVGRRRG